MTNPHFLQYSSPCSLTKSPLPHSGHLFTSSPFILCNDLSSILFMPCNLLFAFIAFKYPIPSASNLLCLLQDKIAITYVANTFANSHPYHHGCALFYSI